MTDIDDIPGGVLAGARRTLGMITYLSESDAIAEIARFALWCESGDEDLTEDPAMTIEEFMAAERIPSGVFIIRALPAGGGKFNALYSAPGLFPAVAQTADGRAYEYSSEREAEWGAARALVGILNAPRMKANRSKGKPERYTKLTGPEFAVLLQRAKITPSFFAFLYGTSQARVLTWIDGTEAVPHPVRVLLEIFIDNPLTIDVAERVTEANTTERDPREPSP